MQHLYLLSTLLLITASQQYCAMKRPNEAQTITTLTMAGKDNPHSVICFPDNIVAMLGSNTLSLWDFATNREIIQLHKGINLINIAAHPHKKILALHSLHNLTVYDIQTRKKIWGKTEESWFCKPMFNPHDDTILIANSQNRIDSFNYINNSYTSYPLDMGRYCPSITLDFHPTKQEFIVVAMDYHKISILQLGQGLSIKKNISVPDYILHCTYSADGSHIAIHSANGCSIANPESKKVNLESKYNISGYNAYAITLHPTSFILATFPSSADNAIHYWNAKTKKYLTSTGTHHDAPDTFSFIADRMNFSCDGTKLIVALKDKCLVLEVPFDALYQPGTKNRCILAYLMLQHYFCNGEVLPKEIVHILIKNMLAASKYSLINY